MRAVLRGSVLAPPGRYRVRPPLREVGSWEVGFGSALGNAWILMWAVLRGSSLAPPGRYCVRPPRREVGFGGGIILGIGGIIAALSASLFCGSDVF